MIKLKEDEVIIEHIERSFLSYAFALFIALICISSGFFLLFWLLQFDTKGIVIFATLMIIGIGIFLRCVISRRANVLIVTDQRVIDIARKGIMGKEISELTLDLVEDVVASHDGFFASLFHLGTLVVIGAHGKMRFEFERVRHPIVLQETIMDVREEYIDKKRYGVHDDEDEEENNENSEDHNEDKKIKHENAIEIIEDHIDALSYKQIISIQEKIEKRIAQYERLIEKRRRKRL